MRPECDQRIGFDGGVDFSTGLAKVHIDDAAVLHIGGKQAERVGRSFGPGDRVPALRLVIIPRKEHVPFVVELQPSNTGKGLIVEIGYSDIEAEVVETPLDFNRCEGANDDRGMRVTSVKGSGEQRNDGQGDRNRADLQMAYQTSPHLSQTLPQAVIIRDNVLGPFQNLLTFGSQAEKSLPPFHQQDSKALLHL